MRLLVLAALAAVAFADVSEFAGYRYDAPASSYGVPQSSVTERHLSALPTAPPTGLNLPIIEHQDFNAFNPLPGAVISTTPAPFIDTSIISSTPAPILDSGLNLNANLPGFGSGLSFTTPAPVFGDIGLSALGSGLVSSTPAPSFAVTSGSQENLGLGLGFGLGGLNGFTTPAPTVFSSTVAPTISTLAPNFNLGSVLGLGSTYGLPNFNAGLGFNTFSTPAPITLGPGGVTTISSLGGLAGPVPQGQQVSRHLYFYAAPDEPEEIRPRINVVAAAPPKKNVKIIFIKTPNPPAPAPISVAAPPQDEEKTLVYVLVKKPEEVQNVEIQTPPPSPPAKPEVFFIKYKTPQEAEQAIAQVQGSAADGSVPILPTDTIGGGGLLSTVSTLPLFSTTTTPAPLLNYIGGGISGPILENGYGLGPRFDDADINSNLISSGAQASSLFSTGYPLISSVSTGESGLLGTTTVAPILPHATYGPPVFKKK